MDAYSSDNHTFALLLQMHYYCRSTSVLIKKAECIIYYVLFIDKLVFIVLDYDHILFLNRW